MLRSLFNREPSRSERTGRTVLSGPRIPRHSSGWAAMLKHLKEEDSLRVLDIGPTSPSNINFLTALGHSCYMADVVQEALTGEWATPPEEEGGAPGFDVHRFIDQTLDLGTRVRCGPALGHARLHPAATRTTVNRSFVCCHAHWRAGACHLSYEKDRAKHCLLPLSPDQRHPIEMQESEPHPYCMSTQTA